MRVSVVVPCYNEEEVIEKSVTALLARLSSFPDFELIVVNDGSTDGTLDILTRLARNRPELVALSYPANRGRGYAMRAGFRKATGDIIVTTEADSSWGDDIVHRLVDALETHPDMDMVIASPHREGGGYVNVPWRRVMLSSVGNRILSRAFGGGVTMSSGMTRAYRAYVIKNLPLEEDKKEIHLEIIGKCLDLGYRVMEIPATLTWSDQRRQSGRGRRKSSFNARKLIYSHLLFSFSESPMLFLGSLSMMFMTIGFLIGCYLIYEWIVGILNPVRPLITIMVLFLITGLQTLIFTFLAYQNRMLKRELLRANMRALNGSTENTRVMEYRFPADGAR
jgi:glycosyltransferase involved in cell wall biosynthesis